MDVEGRSQKLEVRSQSKKTAIRDFRTVNQGNWELIIDNWELVIGDW
jgi:hypothetical protein